MQILQEETRRIKDTYAERDRSGRRKLYRWDSPAATYHDYRKRTGWSAALKKLGVDELSSLRILDVGCGEGSWLRMLVDWGASPSQVHGVDMLADRIAEARTKSCAEIDFRCDNSWPLQFDDDSMDFVAASTVFSSILAREARNELAREMARVTASGGAVAVFDFAVSHPGNSQTVGIPKSEIRRLFPGFDHIASIPLIVLPPVSRRLVPYVPWFVHTLESLIPLLCTHRIYVLRKKQERLSAAA